MRRRRARCGVRRRCLASFGQRPDLAIPLDHPARGPAALDLEVELAPRAGTVVVGGPRVPEHVRAQVTDARADLQTVEEPPDRVTRQLVPTAAREQRSVILRLATP